jgi:hypothetical protein
MTVNSKAAALAEARALREEAWGLVHADVATLRDGLAARPITQRIRERATGEVVEVLEQACDVADDNKAIVAAMVAILAGWFLRGPIGRMFHRPDHDNSDGDSRER